MKNKIILITGATSGLGEAMAKSFAKQGAKIIGTGRRADRLKKLQKQLGKNFLGLEFDIRDETAIKKALRELPKSWAKIDVLINNAGLLDLDISWVFSSEIDCVFNWNSKAQQI